MRDSPVIEDDDDDDFSKVPSPKSVRSIFVVGIWILFSDTRIQIQNKPTAVTTTASK